MSSRNILLNYPIRTNHSFISLGYQINSIQFVYRHVQGNCNIMYNVIISLLPVFKYNRNIKKQYKFYIIEKKIQKNYSFSNQCIGKCHVFNCLMAAGKNEFLSLVVLVLMLLNCLLKCEKSILGFVRSLRMKVTLFWGLQS